MFKDKKKIIIFSLLFIIIVIIIIVTISLLSGKNINYESLESKLVSSAELYYQSNNKLLPKEDGDEAEVTIKKLVSEKYIKPLDKLVKNGEKCQGKVVVKNIDGEYTYIPYLYCGSYYKTEELYNKILGDNEVVTDDKGLYAINDEYIFRGEVDNNYLKVGDNLWRIMGITNENNVKLIYASEHTTSVYDDRYNSDRESNYGKNEYKISRIRETLDSIVENDQIFPLEFKGKLKKINACIGGRAENDENNTMDVECSKVLDDQYSTIITLSEYINTSLDPSCKTGDSSECQNYNYLSRFEKKGAWWTITPDSETSYRAYQISSYGTIGLNPCFTVAGVKPVVYLNSDTLYKGGNGTYTDPYIILNSDIDKN